MLRFVAGPPDQPAQATRIGTKETLTDADGRHRPLTSPRCSRRGRWRRSGVRQWRHERYANLGRLTLLDLRRRKPLIKFPRCAELLGKRAVPMRDRPTTRRLSAASSNALDAHGQDCL